MSRIGRMTSTAATKRRAASGRMRLRATELTASLRRRAGGESRRRRIAWAAVAAVLVIGPLAFNLAREPHFNASVALFPREVRPYPPVFDPEYYRAFLADPELRIQTDLNAGRGVARYEDVEIARGPGRDRLTVSVEAETPERAQRFVNALAPQVAGATTRQLARAVARDIEDVRSRLAAASGADRRFLRGRLRRLESFGEFPPPRVLPGAAAPRPQLERWADRIVDDLPGEFRGRPDPAWSALAGLLVAATLWAICLMLFPPRRS